MTQRVSMPVGQEQLELAMLADMARRAKPENRAALTSQIRGASVVSRDFSGVGCFTNFHIAEDAMRFADSRVEGVGHMVLGDWELMSGAKFPSGAVGMFHIYVAQGQLKMLEGLMLDGEPWPDDVSNFEITP